jgi:hypothetical protein
MFKREEVKEKLKGFETNTVYPYTVNGVLLFIPEEREFCAIAFGDGTNSDSLESNCDDYIYIAIYKFENTEFTDEIDGGQLDFNTKESGYNGDITNAVYDALELVYGCVPDFIPLQNFSH